MKKLKWGNFEEVLNQSGRLTKRKVQKKNRINRMWCLSLIL